MDLAIAVGGWGIRPGGVAGTEIQQAPFIFVTRDSWWWTPVLCKRLFWCNKLFLVDRDGTYLNIAFIRNTKINFNSHNLF